MSKEVSKKLWDLYLSNLEASIKIIDDIIPIIKNFDGKCYNKRLENALNTMTEKKYKVRLSVASFDYRRFSLELGFFDAPLRSVKDDADRNGYRGTVYLSGSYDRVTLCDIYSDYNTWGTNRQTNSKYYSPSSENYFYIDDNFNTRIGSEKIISTLQEEKTFLKVKIEILTEKFSNLDEYETKLKNIKAELKELSDAIPYELTDFFGLKIPSYY